MGVTWVDGVMRGDGARRRGAASLRVAVIVFLAWTSHVDVASAGVVTQGPRSIKVTPRVSYVLLDSEDDAGGEEAGTATSEEEDGSASNTNTTNTTNTTEEGDFWAKFVEGLAKGLTENEDYSNFFLEGGDAPPPGYPGATLTSEDLHAMSAEDAKFALKKQESEPGHTMSFRTPDTKDKMAVVRLGGAAIMILGSIVTIPKGRSFPSKCGPHERVRGCPRNAKECEKQERAEFKKNGKGCILPQGWKYTQDSFKKKCRAKHCGPKDGGTDPDAKSKCPQCCQCEKQAGWVKMLFIQVFGFLLMLIGGFLMYAGGVALGGAIFWILWLIAVVSNITFAFRCHYAGC